MITVEMASALVLGLARSPDPETVAVQNALGRAMVEPAIAQITQPPFDSAAMDGYALRNADLPGPLTVIGTSSAGHPWAGSASPGSAIRIFTGAMVPEGYDRVVMQELVSRDGDQITVAETGSRINIRPHGTDFKEGYAFKPDRFLTPADLGFIAAMNVAEVTVARRPRVAIMAGGDELVRPGEVPGPGQIICSNDISIAALVTEAGAEPHILPIARDTEVSLRAGFQASEGFDLIVTIGGASVGDHDLVGKVAEDLGLERAFYKLAMRPGKPLMAGRMGQTAMLGLPGNPVSAMVCAILFMQPLLRAMQGIHPGPRLFRARLGTPLPPEGDRQHYLRARLTPGLDLPVITTFSNQDSGMLRILADADALLVRRAHDPAREGGEIVDFIPLPR